MTNQKTNGTGLPRNTVAMLCYALGPLTGFIFLILEKDDFVRFHAMQSIVVFGILFVLIPVFSFAVPIGFVLWLVFMYKSFHGEKWKLPFVGKIIEDALGN